MDDKDLLDYMPPPSLNEQQHRDFYHESQPLTHTQINTDEFDPLAAHQQVLHAHRESPIKEEPPEEPQHHHREYRTPTPEDELRKLPPEKNHIF